LVTAFVGSSNGDVNGKGTATQFNYPEGTAVDKNNKIRHNEAEGDGERFSNSKLVKVNNLNEIYYEI
jgi:hypothetical protein